MAPDDSQRLTREERRRLAKAEKSRLRRQQRAEEAAAHAAAAASGAQPPVGGVLTRSMRAKMERFEKARRCGGGIAGWRRLLCAVGLPLSAA